MTTAATSSRDVAMEAMGEVATEEVSLHDFSINNHNNVCPWMNHHTQLNRVFSTSIVDQDLLEQHSKKKKIPKSGKSTRPSQETMPRRVGKAVGRVRKLNAAESGKASDSLETSGTIERRGILGSELAPPCSDLGKLGLKR